MPRRTPAESEATAAAVLESAITLFSQRGFAGVRIEEVAEAAGVTRGAVYHHYTDKAALFAAAAAAVHAEVGATVAARADAEDDPWTGFEVGCRAYLEAALTTRARRILLLEAPTVLGWEIWRRQDAAGSAHHLHDALGELAAAGLLASPSSVPATAAAINGALNEAALWAAGQSDETGSDAALDDAWLAVRTLLQAMRAPSGA